MTARYQRRHDGTCAHEAKVQVDPQQRTNAGGYERQREQQIGIPQYALLLTGYLTSRGWRTPGILARLQFR